MSIKVLLKIFLLFLLSFVSLKAVDIDIKMGLGSQYAKSEGELIFAKDFWANSSGEISHENAPGIYTWIEVKPSESYLPQVYIEFSQLKTDGSSFINIETQSDELNGIIDFLEEKTGQKINEIPFNSRLIQTDVEGYLYYEFFQDSGFPTLALGAGIKNFDFDYKIAIMEGVELNAEGGDTIPLLFFKTDYMISEKSNGSSVSCELAGRLYVFGDSNVYDYMGKIDFMTPYNEDTSIGMELGYKKSYIHIKGDDIDTLAGVMSTVGVYIALVAYFR